MTGQGAGWEELVHLIESTPEDDRQTALERFDRLQRARIELVRSEAQRRFRLQIVSLILWFVLELAGCAASAYLAYAGASLASAALGVASMMWLFAGLVKLRQLAS